MKKPGILKRMFDSKPTYDTEVGYRISNLDDTDLDNLVVEGKTKTGFVIENVKGGTFSNFYVGPDSTRRDAARIISELIKKDDIACSEVADLLRILCSNPGKDEQKSTYQKILELIKLHWDVLSPFAGPIEKIYSLVSQ